MVGWELKDISFFQLIVHGIDENFRNEPTGLGWSKFLLPTYTTGAQNEPHSKKAALDGHTPCPSRAGSACGHSGVCSPLHCPFRQSIHRSQKGERTQTHPKCLPISTPNALLLLMIITINQPITVVTVPVKKGTLKPGYSYEIFSWPP